MNNEPDESALPRVEGYVCLPWAKLVDGAYSVSPVRSRDIESIRIWRNAQREVLRQVREITPAEQGSYFRRSIWPEMSMPRPRNILLSYFREERLIGYGGLVHIAWEHLRSEVSFLLDPAIAGDSADYRACFATFLRLMQELAFQDLGFNRLFTETFASRQEHMQILEKAGFQQEGVLRNHVRINGRSVDSVIHGCLSKTRGGRCD